MQTIDISKVKYFLFNNKNVPYLYIDKEFFLELKELLSLLTENSQQHRVQKCSTEGLILFETDERPKKLFIGLETAEKEFLTLLLKQDEKQKFDFETIKKSLFQSENLVYKTKKEIETDFQELTQKNYELNANYENLQNSFSVLHSDFLVKSDNEKQLFEDFENLKKEFQNC